MKELLAQLRRYVDSICGAGTILSMREGKLTFKRKERTALITALESLVESQTPETARQMREAILGCQTAHIPTGVMVPEARAYETMLEVISKIDRQLTPSREMHKVKMG